MTWHIFSSANFYLFSWTDCLAVRRLHLTLNKLNLIAEKDLRVLVDNYEPAVCPCGQESQWCPWVHQEEHGQQVEGDHPSSLLCPEEAASDILCVSSLGLPSASQTWNCMKGFSGRLQGCLWAWSTSPRDHSLFNVEIRRLRGVLSVHMNILMEDIKRMGLGSIHWCSVTRWWNIYVCNWC